LAQAGIAARWKNRDQALSAVKTLVSNGCGFVAGLLQNNGKARVDVFIQFEPHVAGFNGMSTYRSLVISAA
jgi:hypothetical protein